MQSAGLMAVHQTKLDRYALLAALAERQALDGLRSTAPIILPVAVSTHGEFCPGAVRVHEWLTGKYRARLLLEGDRDDGEKTEDLTAAFGGSSAPLSWWPPVKVSPTCSSLQACPLRASGRLAGAAPVVARHMLHHNQHHHPHYHRYQTATARNPAACAVARQLS